MVTLGPSGYFPFPAVPPPPNGFTPEASLANNLQYYQPVFQDGTARLPYDYGVANSGFLLGNGRQFWNGYQNENFQVGSLPLTGQFNLGNALERQIDQFSAAQLGLAPFPDLNTVGGVPAIFV